MSHRLTCGFQVVVRNTRNERTHGLRPNQKPKYATHTREKCNARNWFYPCIHCIYRVRALHALRLFWSASHDQHALRPLCCIRQLGNQPLKSVFIGLHALSKLSYARHATQQMHGLWHNQKLKYATHASENTSHTIDSILCMCCIFRRFSYACIACIALRTTPWKPTFGSVFCILTAAAVSTFGTCRPTSAGDK